MRPVVQGPIEHRRPFAEGIVEDARGVLQQVPDRDRRQVISIGGEEPDGGRGEVPVDRVVNAQASVLDQAQDRRRRERLSDACNSHRFGRRVGEIGGSEPVGDVGRSRPGHAIDSANRGDDRGIRVRQRRCATLHDRAKCPTVGFGELQGDNLLRCGRGADVGTAAGLVARVDDDTTSVDEGGVRVVSVVDATDETAEPAEVPPFIAESVDRWSVALEQAPTRITNAAAATERRRNESLIRIDIY